MLGNKGASETAVDWFVAMLFTVMVVIMLLIIVSAYKARTVDSTSVDPEVYVAKLYFSQDILRPESNTLIFGVVEEDGFTTENLNVRNAYADRFVGAQLTLKEADGSNVTQPIYNDEALFREKYPLAVNNIGGAGGAKLSTFTYPVMIEKDGVQRPGFLEVVVVVPR